jgi:tetratricopeptide (TPR) repeat protein
MEKDMNLIQQRRLAKIAKQNAQKEAAKPANKDDKGNKPVVSKMRQKLQEQKAASETRAAEKLAAKDAAEKLAAQEVAEKSESEKTNDLENQVDGVEGSVDELKTDLETQGEKTDELAGTVNELSNDLDSVKDDVSDLDGRLDWVENDVQKIKEKLEDDSEYIGNPELETHKVILAAGIDEMLDVEDIEDRKAYKAEAIVKLEAFVMGYVQSAVKYPNIVAVWFMIWLFDLGDIARAVPLGLHLAKQKIHRMPTRFKSTIDVFICNYIYDWAAKQLEANKSAGPYLEQVIKAIELGELDLKEKPITKGKVYAIYGKHLDALAEDEPALKAYEKAMEINPRAGVKKRIEQLTAKLAKTKES